MQGHSVPLQAFPVVTCEGLEKLKAGIDGLFGACKLDAPKGTRRGGLKSTINHRAMRHVGLLYGNYSSAFDVKLGPSDNFAQGFPRSGYGEHRVGNTVTIASPGIASNTVIAPGESAELRYKTGFDHLVLVIKREPLLEKLGALAGTSPRGKLDFVKRADYGSPNAAALRRLVGFVAEELSGFGPASPTLALVELEQALMVSFLCSNESNVSHLLCELPPSSAAWQVRRAEEYIAAHWSQPITIDALALVTNVSARSLFHSFQRSRGYSPMVLVKQIRLQHAREMLSRPRPGVSVTDVAYRCGFGNLGHFARDYLARFGERPSDTLRSSRS